ncbi:hypothetical protein [Vibrio sp. SCSIO 43136]|uniref:hypothetical protein n=1 Tax=Vibrio sp. SCSIO 43136 TaxID=2819101 RepID=UPI0020764EA0|nr:hypothetical protein [Vibrio sp. SCSIO 43136]USD67332.1 hypothetical protein J4N39_22135 [Vibrio sp. SCSIO 43136]
MMDRAFKWFTLVNSAICVMALLYLMSKWAGEFYYTYQLDQLQQAQVSYNELSHDITSAHRYIVMLSDQDASKLPSVIAQLAKAHTHLADINTNLPQSHTVQNLTAALKDVETNLDLLTQLDTASQSQAMHRLPYQFGNQVRTLLNDLGIELHLNVAKTIKQAQSQTQASRYLHHVAGIYIGISLLLLLFFTVSKHPMMRRSLITHSPR